MRQYEIRWATLPPPVGRRPVLLLTRPAAYEYLTKVVVAEVTTRVRGIPQEVVHVVPTGRLGDAIGTLKGPRHREVKRALGYALDWPELKML